MSVTDRPRREPHHARGAFARATAAASGVSDGGPAAFERNMHSYLANQLGREIVGGVFPPGSLLPNEMEMCARFSVSRTTLREAYGVLTAKALIVARPKVGTKVRPKSDWNMLDPEVLAWHLETVPTEDFIHDLYKLRQIIEPAAAALAAATQSRGTIDRIAAAYADMERFKEGGGDDLIAADLQFHLAILDATENLFISALGGLIHAALLGSFKLSWSGAERNMREDRLQQHKAVFAAIREGLPERARQRMHELLADSINDVHEVLRKRGVNRERAASNGARAGAAKKRRARATR
jgi:DNA-binding FadR family transcriptional regulator